MFRCTSVSLLQVSSELSPLPDIILMATDEEAYAQWLKTFGKISGYFFLWFVNRTHPVTHPCCLCHMLSAYEELCRRDGGRDASMWVPPPCYSSVIFIWFVVFHSIMCAVAHTKLNPWSRLLQLLKRNFKYNGHQYFRGIIITNTQFWDICKNISLRPASIFEVCLVSTSAIDMYTIL